MKRKLHLQQTSVFGGSSRWFFREFYSGTHFSIEDITMESQMNRCFTGKPFPKIRLHDKTGHESLGGGFKYLYFHPLPRKMIQFDLRIFFIFFSGLAVRDRFDPPPKKKNGALKVGGAIGSSKTSEVSCHHIAWIEIVFKILLMTNNSSHVLEVVSFWYIIWPMDLTKLVFRVFRLGWNHLPQIQAIFLQWRHSKQKMVLRKVHILFTFFSETDIFMCHIVWFKNLLTP